MKNTKGYRIFNFITKIISWCVMAILVVTGGLLLTIVVLNKIADAKGELSPMGLYTIISPSMTPDIEVYDVVFVVRKDPSEIEIGDIVSYYSTISSIGDIPVTHRVVEKFNTNTGVSFRTKGDANEVVDNEIVMGERVIGTVRLVIPFLGRIQFFLASKGGWFIAILIPALGIIIYDIVKLVKLLSVKNKMKLASGIEDKTKRTLKNENNNRKEIPKEENYNKKIKNSKIKNLEKNYKYDDELDYIRNDRNRNLRKEYDNSYRKDYSNKTYKEDYIDDEYEYPKVIKKDKNRKENYEEELNKLIDKLNEYDEKEKYTKSEYYKDYNKNKRSSRK